jgi:hypothetical protein
MEDIDTLDGRYLAFLYYVGRCSGIGPFIWRDVVDRFPFATRLFGDDTIGDLFSWCTRRGFLDVVSQGPVARYSVRTRLDPDLLYRAVQKRLVMVPHSYARDKFAQIVADLSLEDFLLLNARINDQENADCLLSDFACDLRIGESGWWRRTCKFAHLYAEVANKATPLSELLFSFAHLTDMDIPGSREYIGGRLNKAWQNDEIAYLKVGIDSITPWTSLSVQVFLVRWSHFTIDDRNRLRAAALDALLKEATVAHLVIPIGLRAEISDEILRSTHLIVLTPKDTKNIVVDQRPREKFRETMRSRMDIELLSPYQVTGFVSGPMFHGRQHEIRLICAHQRTNYAIYGARQSGKTSLMKALEALWKQDAVFINCDAISTEKDFIRHLCPFLGVKQVTTFEDLLSLGADVRHKGRLLVDEVDHLLKFMDVSRLVAILRTLNEEHDFQCIMAGGRRLYEASRDNNSPMYNFADPLPLGPFTELEATELAREPMRSLFVNYEEGESTIRQLTNLCGRLPNLIQLMCQELVRKVKLLEAKVITPSMLEEVYHSAAFEDYVTRQFDVCFDPTQRLVICAALLAKEMPIQAIVERVQKYHRLHYSEIKKALDDLVFMYVLSRERDVYRWVYDKYPAILQRCFRNPDFRISQIIMEIEDAGHQ